MSVADTLRAKMTMLALSDIEVTYALMRLTPEERENCMMVLSLLRTRQLLDDDADPHRHSSWSSLALDWHDQTLRHEDWRRHWAFSRGRENGFMLGLVVGVILFMFSTALIPYLTR